jgi:hypothetical protein
MSNNPFLKPKNVDRFTSKKPNSRSNSKPTSRPSINSFSSKKYEEKEKQHDFIFTDEFFPILAPIVSNKNVNTNFKDALEQHVIIEKSKTLPSGWIEINKYKEEEDNTNYNLLMNNIIKTTLDKHYNHKLNFDSINGEGAYDELHYMKPIYDIDLDEDLDDHTDDNESFGEDPDDYINDDF